MYVPLNDCEFLLSYSRICGLVTETQVGNRVSASRATRIGNPEHLTCVKPGRLAKCFDACWPDREARPTMDHPQDLRAKAQRCRDLLQTAVRQDVRDQLREWAKDFDAEAEQTEIGRLQ